MYLKDQDPTTSATPHNNLFAFVVFILIYYDNAMVNSLGISKAELNTHAILVTESRLLLLQLTTEVLRSYFLDFPVTQYQPQ